MNARRRALALAALAAAALPGAGCSGLLPKAPPPPALFTLYAAPRPVAADAPSVLPTLALPTLVLMPVLAAAGYDSRRIVYTRQPQRLEAFAQHEWVDAPARLLAPLLLAAIESQGGFAAVVAGPAAASGELRLHTEIQRLQHEFGPLPGSQVRFTLRATLVDVRTRRVLATRTFDETRPAASDDAYGGVLAAQQAVQAVALQLAEFCAANAGGSRRDP